MSRLDDLYELICRCMIEDRGMPPRFRDIIDHGIGYTTPSTVHYDIDRLIERGLMKRISSLGRNSTFQIPGTLFHAPLNVLNRIPFSAMRRAIVDRSFHHSIPDVSGQERVYTSGKDISAHISPDIPRPAQCVVTSNKMLALQGAGLGLCVYNHVTLALYES